MKVHRVSLFGLQKFHRDVMELKVTLFLTFPLKFRLLFTPGTLMQQELIFTQRKNVQLTLQGT